MTFAVYGKNGNSTFIEEILVLIEVLKSRNSDIFLYKPLGESLSKEHNINISNFKLFSNYNDLTSDIDVFISIGGDGTFLETKSLVRDLNIPILGINTGRLGFLALVSQHDISNIVNEIIEGKYTIDQRSMLQLIVDSDEYKGYNVALNDITIQKKDTTLILIDTYVSGEHLTSYWADGLIIATPTGSTAYSLSVGGPIVSPSLNSIIISPIAPHNLSLRPIVIPDENEIKIKVESRSLNFLVSLDHHSEVISTSVNILIKKAPYKLNIIKPENSSFYDTLRNKLMWGMDKRNI